MRPAVGAHPLYADTIGEEEWATFELCLEKTSYVGEVGLDYSSSKPSRSTQERAFTRVLTAVSERPKVLSVHSRRADQAVLDHLKGFDFTPVIFHWYSGPLGILDQIIDQGHYFSFNPAMVRSARGRGVISRVPRARALAETDGPYVRIGNRPVLPSDVELVYRYLASVWGETEEQTARQLRNNFNALLQATGVVRQTSAPADVSPRPSSAIPS